MNTTECKNLKCKLMVRVRWHLPNRLENLFKKQTNFTFRRVEFRLRERTNSLFYDILFAENMDVV